MTTRQIIATICRCAAAVLAGCLLVADCGSAGSGSGPAGPAAASARPAPAAGPTTPLVMGGQVLVTGTRT